VFYMFSLQFCRQSVSHIAGCIFRRFCKISKACVLLIQASRKLTVCYLLSSSDISKDPCFETSGTIYPTTAWRPRRL
jgi:hypothetical protein